MILDDCLEKTHARFFPAYRADREERFFSDCTCFPWSRLKSNLSKVFGSFIGSLLSFSIVWTMESYFFCSRYSKTPQTASRASGVSSFSSA